MNMKKLFALLLAVLMVVGVFAGCGGSDETQPATQKPTENKPTGTQGTQGTKPTELVIEKFEGDFIWKTSVSTLASNWNPHTYQTTDDSVPLDYTTSSLYTFIFNDELHPVEGKEPYTGYAIVPEMALELPIDVTNEVKAAHPEFNIPESAEAGYAYKIVLRDDLCWDDGTPINAETFVESFKRLLDPRFLNYRAADWYGQTLSIAGAEYYFNQGNASYVDNATQSKANMVKGDDGNYYTSEGWPVYIALDNADGLSWLGGYTLKFYVEYYSNGDGTNAYFDETNFADLLGAMDENGLIALNDENYEWLKTLITGNAAWGESEADISNYFVYHIVYPETYDWSNVGILATGENELTIVLDRSLAGFDLLYNLSGVANQLVKIDLYDACLKVEEGAGGEEVWSSTYNTSVETTASFGPYKMSQFQTSKAMHFVRNDKWFGYTDGNHIYKDPVDGKVYPMYQTTEIDIQVVGESATNKLMFMKGQLMGYGLQADDFASLRHSEYCYATPGSTIFFLILNGHMEAIQERESSDSFDKATQDLEMLTNKAFHMALGLAYDKDNFAATVSPARSGGLGIIGTSYIYDPETGARYRDTDQAKKVLCDFYGVDYTKFPTLDDAVATITGYDPEQAKVLLGQAFQEGIEAGYINDANGDGICDQEIRIEYALSSDSEFMTKTLNYMNEKIAEVAEGTPFEGKIIFVKSAPYGTEWSNKIREGQADTVLGGWSGSLLDPFGLTDLYTNPSKQYDAAWYDATKVELTINVPVNGVNQDVTLTLKQWSDALNGTVVKVNGVEYNYGSGQADIQVRLDILAACEGKILESYNYLPMLQDGSMALLSMQVYYVVEEYNPIMGRGGIAYTKYNYNEDEWAAYVAEQGGELSY